MRPICPQHGDAVFDLALGILEDGEAESAEVFRTECPGCAEGWHAFFTAEAMADLDAEVAESFRTVVFPRRGRRRGWLAAAAAVIVMLAGTSLWRVAEEKPGTGPSQVVSIGSFDFEDGAMAESFSDSMGIVEGTSADSPDSVGGVLVFSDGLEDGRLDDWVVNS